MTDYPFLNDVQIHWSDMDALGHVNNARYFTYIESARINLLQESGIAKLWDERTGPILAQATCQFKKPITYPSLVKVGTWISRLGNSSFTVNHDLIVEGEVMAKGETVAVWCDYQKGKPEPLSPEMRDILKNYLKESTSEN
jgi:acyl-CoA thioester hydrolase